MYGTDGKKQKKNHGKFTFQKQREIDLKFLF